MTMLKRRPGVIQRRTLSPEPDSDHGRWTRIQALPEYRYLVVGGGMTGDAACRGIRDEDDAGTIGLVGSEQHPPYVRPPLTKALWTGKEESSIWRKTDELGVDVHIGRRIVSLDPDARTATDDEGATYSYERILLATGGTPRQLPSAPDGVIYYRTYDTYRQLRERVRDGLRVAVVGGGFIGSEIAAALAMNGCSVTILFPEPGIGARLFPSNLSSFVNDYYRSKDVEVLAEELVAGISREDGSFRVETKSGRTVEADEVVAGLGIVPNTDLAESIGLEVDDGIIVDDRGRAGGRDDVFAAGDVARFPVATLGGARRVEHEDHANTHGRHVGANMAGADEPYHHLPFFYSDLFELGYEAVGDVDSRLDTVAEWEEPNRKGVVCYVEDGKPRGFLLWDVWGKVDAARELIAAGDDVEPEMLRGLLAE
jgi:3-phenylpropionate/trans-cinnamate dioxygenase ferredoxin reductase subunit